MEKEFTPEESLRIIQKSIFHSRRNMREGSFYFVLWGWVVILASVTNYLVLRYYLQIESYSGLWLKSILVWAFYIGAAFIVQYIRMARSSRHQKVVTHISRYITILWLSSGVVMALMAFLSYKAGSYPSPFILGIVALATFVSGMMVKYAPLMAGGFIFFIASVIAIYIQGIGQLLVVAIAMVPGYLVPGYMLRTIRDGEDV